MVGEKNSIGSATEMATNESSIETCFEELNIKKFIGAGEHSSIVPMLTNPALEVTNKRNIIDNLVKKTFEVGSMSLENANTVHSTAAGNGSGAAGNSKVSKLNKKQKNEVKENNDKNSTRKVATIRDDDEAGPSLARPVLSTDISGSTSTSGSTRVTRRNRIQHNNENKNKNVTENITMDVTNENNNKNKNNRLPRKVTEE